MAGQEQCSDTSDRTLNKYFWFVPVVYHLTHMTGILFLPIGNQDPNYPVYTCYIYDICCIQYMTNMTCGVYLCVLSKAMLEVIVTQVIEASK